MTAEYADAALRPSDGAEAVLVALGSNLGDRSAYLALARERVADAPDCRLEAATEPEETDPIGPTGQPPYLNQMLLVRTQRSPLALLDLLQEAERAAGRERTERWGSRTLDCDVVMFGMRNIRHPRLTVPHPEIANRPFWQHELRALGVAWSDREPPAPGGEGAR